MIGIFDSGLGGVISSQYIRTALPEYDYLVLADSAFVPYGERDAQRIQDRTFACLHWLFDQGCHLVILACNTASTYAIHAWQDMYPEKKVLSVTVPGIEDIVEKKLHHIGVLATKATVTTNLYPMLFERYFPAYDITIEQVVGEGLVDLIEAGAPRQVIRESAERYVGLFSEHIEALVLGCTHYPLLAIDTRSSLSLINPGAAAAEKLVEYLHRHPEIESLLTKQGHIQYLTTGDKNTLEQQIQRDISPIQAKTKVAGYVVRSVHV